MGRDDDAQLRAAKRGYKEAAAEGNREEEARWANTIGDMLKTRGEYVEALRWLRLDYEVSVKCLPQKQILPTCQSLGEVLLRLNQHKDALVYQKKHLELAKESNDLIEQQRACTQLGRTYHEIFLKSEDDHYAIRNSKKYFKSAMKLAQKLKINHAGHKTSHFLKEFIDAHNNIGMLELDLDNLDEAEKILLKGLKICDEEEVNENDDCRSRLHHNLGSVYLDLRKWGQAKEHIEKDILICKRIEHKQGESKGFINLGELHYRLQKYEEATKCYQKALEIAEVMEDEDSLVDQITQNLKTVGEAMQVWEDLKIEEQKFRRLARITCNAKGTPQERGFLLEQNTSLDRLIEKSGMIFAWKKHQEYAKRKKRVAMELCDVEKLSDSYLAVGESYQKLRNFSKARKWYMKSWNKYRSIGNLEGQALAKINIGEVLDSSGDWTGALVAFEEGYRIAVEGKLFSVQLSALENMHYSHMIRFDNIEDARNLQQEIQNLKCLVKDENELRNIGTDYCSETETEGYNRSGTASSDCDSLAKSKIGGGGIDYTGAVEQMDDSVPLASMFKRKKRKTDLESIGKMTGSSCRNEGFTKSNRLLGEESIDRKRVRVVISDDEDDTRDDMDAIKQRVYKTTMEDVATSCEDIQNGNERSYANEAQDLANTENARDVLSTCTPVNLEEKSCSFKSKFPKILSPNDMRFGFLSDMEDTNTPNSAASESKTEHPETSGSMHFGQSTGLNISNAYIEIDCKITVKVGSHFIHVDKRSCLEGDKLNSDLLKVEVACLYYLQLAKDKQSKGLLPIIQNLKFLGRNMQMLESTENLDHCLSGNNYIESVINAWVPKRLMKLYVDYCEKSSEEPNLILLKKLYSLEVSEDEIIISDCGLQDTSISPLVEALHEHKTIALLDVSHNLLGNETMERLRRMFNSSSQTYGSLTLDLHCNHFGPTSLFQICECPVVLARLEVLNLSGNRLTDASCSYLSTILAKCRALYSLSIEQCSITSRTIQRISDVLDENHVLSQLNIGKNGPISGNSIIGLLTKLAKLKRFSDLSLTGIKLNKNAISSICELVGKSDLSSLILGRTGIGSEGAVSITEALSSTSQELVKFDISYCGLIAKDISKVCANAALSGGLLELNLEGNSLGMEGCDALGSLLRDPQCSLKILILNTGQLGLSGIVKLLQALEENISLEELHVADNANVVQEATLPYEAAMHISSSSENETKSCEAIFSYRNMEVADSEDELTKEEATAAVGIGGSCITANLLNSKPLATCHAVQELSRAISSAKQLMLLDLSRNRFSLEDVGLFYASWSSRDGVSARKHLTGDTVHFFVEGKTCCCVRACCKREGTV